MNEQSDENVIYLDDGRKEIFFTINGIEYTLIISLDELLSPKTEVNDSFDYRNFVSTQLVNAICENVKPSIQEVSSQNDKFFINIFDSFLNDNNEFYTLLEKSQAGEICERYIETYCRYRMKNLPSTLESVNENLSKTILKMGELTTAFLQSVDLSFVNKMTDTINSALSVYANNAKTILTGLSVSLENLAKISESLISGIFEFVKEINIPQYTQEEKKALIKSYERWGKYGWTVPPYAAIDCFNTCPKTLLEADELALKYCKKEDMQELFLLLENLCVRKRDLREAIECYNQHLYKACALILFSIIDSRIIRLQNKKDERFGVGIGAIAKFKDIAKKKTTEEGKLFIALYYTNIFPCLFTMFEDTEKFSKKTTVINRNYLDHGMSSRVVRKKDCIKLFLLLYNLLELIDIIK